MAADILGFVNGWWDTGQAASGAVSAEASAREQGLREAGQAAVRKKLRGQGDSHPRSAALGRGDRAREMAQLLGQLAVLASQLAHPKNAEHGNVCTVEGMSDAQGPVQVWPVSNMTDVVVRGCGGGGGSPPVLISVKAACRSVTIEHCTNVTVECVRVMDTVDARCCQKVQLNVGGRHPGVSFDRCHGVILTANASALRSPGVVARASTAIVLQRPRTDTRDTHRAKELSGGACVHIPTHTCIHACMYMGMRTCMCIYVFGSVVASQAQPLLRSL